MPESVAAVLQSMSRNDWMQSASKFAGLAALVFSEGFGGQGIQRAGYSIGFDSFIPGIGIKLHEPVTKPGKFVRCKVLDGFFNGFDGAHRDFLDS